MTTAPASYLNVADGSSSGAGRQVVHSPEQVALDLPLAGPASRILAYAIDCAVIMLLEVLGGAALLLSTALPKHLLEWLQPILNRLSEGDPQALANSGFVMLFFALALIVQFALELGYFIFWEMASGGRSLGKIAVGLRVLRDGGAPLRLRESLVRNLLRMVDLLPGSYGVGLVSMVLSDHSKRLGDLAAGTIVVRLDRPAAAEPLALPDATALAAFRFERVQLQRIGSAERALLRQTLRRLDSLSPAQADSALHQATEALRLRIGYGEVEAADRRTFLFALLNAVQRL